MSVPDLFHLLIACHIVTGSVGLVSFWVPVLGRKGTAAHRLGGRVFTATMLATGSLAIAISLCTLADPVGTHPHLMSHPDFGDPRVIRTVFGWLMLFLAILTINLAWYGWVCVTRKRDRVASRDPLNLALQALLLTAGINVAWHAVALGVPLMAGLSVVGFATVGTNLWYLYKPVAGPRDWLAEHVKALVGAGISVYTAFFAFGAVRLMPEAALTPALWSAPLVVGLALILWHRRAILRPRT